MPGGPKHDNPVPQVDASLYLHPQTLSRLGSFELRAKMIVEGLSSGTHRSPFRGFSVEFAQHRPYVSGDDLRHLDWKVYGRSDKLQLKQYQQETTLDLIVMVDISGSMNYGSRSFAEASGTGRREALDGRLNWTKFDHATAVAAALAYITLRQSDRVGLVIFADRVLATLRRTSGPGTWRQVIGTLSTHPAQTPGAELLPTDFGRAVEQVLGQVTNRCLVAVVSDFFTDLDNVRAAMARLKHARHDVIAFQVMDRRELAFDFADAAPFVGLEGEAALRVDPRALRGAYLKAVAAHVDGVEKVMRGLGFDYQLVSTHEWLGPTLAAFVARRSAMMRRSKYG
jgi:uncharacterized protein (DUF58 family)